jgi:hypothetical protein
MRRRNWVGVISAALALWRLIDWFFNAIGFVDTVRGLMDPTHWIYKVLFWPHLGNVMTAIGSIAVLALVRVTLRRPAKDEKPSTAPSAAVQPVTPAPVPAPRRVPFALEASVNHDGVDVLIKNLTTQGLSGIGVRMHSIRRLTASGEYAEIPPDLQRGMFPTGLDGPKLVLFRRGGPPTYPGYDLYRFRLIGFKPHMHLGSPLEVHGAPGLHLQQGVYRFRLLCEVDGHSSFESDICLEIGERTRTDRVPVQPIACPQERTA